MTAGLYAGVVSLIKDLNGNHVVQRCLQRLGPTDSEVCCVICLCCLCECECFARLSRLSTRGWIQTRIGRVRWKVCCAVLSSAHQTLTHIHSQTHSLPVFATHTQFIYQAAGQHCCEVATHRHGCCVLQRCIDFATPSQRKELVEHIASHALSLSQVS